MKLCTVSNFCLLSHIFQAKRELSDPENAIIGAFSGKTLHTNFCFSLHSSWHVWFILYNFRKYFHGFTSFYPSKLCHSLCLPPLLFPRHTFFYIVTTEYWCISPFWRLLRLNLVAGLIVSYHFLCEIQLVKGRWKHKETKEHRNKDKRLILQAYYCKMPCMKLWRRPYFKADCDFDGA